MSRNCLTCNKSIKDGPINKKYCNSVCYRTEKGTCGAYKGLSTGTVGAIAEIKVSSDLMIRGFEVYRAMSPASSCDVLATKNNNTYTFEVRTGYRPNATLAPVYSKNNIRANIVAVVIHQTGEIIYLPDLPE